MKITVSTVLAVPIFSVWRAYTTPIAIAFDAKSTYSGEQQRAGWQAILESFARYVELRH